MIEERGLRIEFKSGAMNFLNPQSSILNPQSSILNPAFQSACLRKKDGIS
jgi:hypothetical protein